MTPGLTRQPQGLFPIREILRHGSAVQPETQDDGSHRKSVVSFVSLRCRNHRQLIPSSLLFRPVFHDIMIPQFPEQKSQSPMIYLFDRLQSDLRPADARHRILGRFLIRQCG